jgi:hypothetical protein
MLAAILFAIPTGVLPAVQLPQPTHDCQLEVLTPSAIEEHAVADFQTRIQSYVGLHRRFVRAMGAPPIGDDEGGIFGEELRAALVAGRPQARQGSIFTPVIEGAFRARIDRALLRGLTVTAGRLYDPVPGEPSPAVNSAFPAVAAVTWQALFLELPELPGELGYALWGRDLVLVDVVANLVVDVLPDALPDGAHPGVLYQ